MHEIFGSRPIVLFVIAACMAMAVPLVGTADSIKIGAIVAATGNNETQGRYVRDGILLAVEEINRRGGVNRSRLEITFADSASDPKVAVDAFNKMEAALHPLLYISYASNVGTALAPLAETHHVVVMGLGTSAVDFTRGREWVFRYWPLGPTYLPPLLRILKDLKVRSLGIIYQNEEFGKEQQRLMTSSFSEAGGSVLVQSFEMKDTDYRQQIAALKDREAIYIAGSGANLLNVTRQLKESGYRGHILLPVGGADTAMFGLPEMSGVYVAAPIIHNPGNLYAREAGERFVARYKKPFNQWAANGYDFIKLIGGLLEEQDISRKGVRDVLAAGFEYSGVFGHVRLRPGEHDLTYSLYPTQILNGALTYR